jgi:hypothetical protein
MSEQDDALDHWILDAENLAPSPPVEINVVMSKAVERGTPT